MPFKIPSCAGCQLQLEDNCAILYSPPKNPELVVSDVDKMHLCMTCYGIVLKVLFQEKVKQIPNTKREHWKNIVLKDDTCKINPHSAIHFIKALRCFAAICGYDATLRMNKEFYDTMPMFNFKKVTAKTLDQYHRFQIANRGKYAN